MVRCFTSLQTLLVNEIAFTRDLYVSHIVGSAHISQEALDHLAPIVDLKVGNNTLAVIP